MIGERWPRETPSDPSGAPTIIAVLSRPQFDTTVCTVVGTVNTGTTLILRDALTEARHDDNAHLVIDLSAITSMDLDSAGLYTLLEARHKHNVSGGGHLAVVVDSNSSAISELDIITLEVSFDLHHNLADALRACADAGPDSPIVGIKEIHQSNQHLSAPKFRVDR